MSWVGWAIAVGGPLLGIAAVMALVIAHEHGKQLRRLPVRLPAGPTAVRRASTALLDEYLVEERGASAAARRVGHARLVAQVERGSTVVLEEFMEERGEVGVVVRPVVVRPAAARRAVVRAAPVFERAPRPTRLVPLTPEIAIG